MSKVGILLHVYHLEAQGWEKLVWGDPATDRLGSGTLLVRTLLDIPAGVDVVAVVFSGPSQKDGLSEGAYTKKFLVDRIDQLAGFPSLKSRLDALTPEAHQVFLSRLQGLVVGPAIRNTLAEIGEAAAFFGQDAAITTIHQLAVASHAPRCLLNQLIARRDGLIPAQQTWYITGSDVPYDGTVLEDGYVVEAPHRGDDPMLGFEPSLATVLRQHYYVAGPDGARKQRIIWAMIQAGQEADDSDSQQDNN